MGDGGGKLGAGVGVGEGEGEGGGHDAVEMVSLDIDNLIENDWGRGKGWVRTLMVLH